MSHPFLSDDWMAAATAIREKYADQAAKVTTSIRMNQVITEVPFGDGTVNLFMDTSSGDVVMATGALDAPDLTMTTDWETARKIFVEQDQAAGMQAFMSGKIKVQGRHDEDDGDADLDAQRRHRQADRHGDQGHHRLSRPSGSVSGACCARWPRPSSRARQPQHRSGTPCGTIRAALGPR